MNSKIDPKVLFKRALEQASATVKCIESRHFKNNTPCTDWNCQTLINHMLYELSWLPDVLAGKTVSQVGKKYDGDLLGKNHVKSWQSAADKAILAVNHVDLKNTVHLSYGDKSAGYYLNEIGTDLLIHSWDAAQSLHCSLLIEQDLVENIYNDINPRKKEYANSGLFGESFDVPKTSRMQTKLLALLGRHEPKVKV